MIDNLALGLSHGLMLLAAWRLLRRADLDDPRAAPGSVQTKRPWIARRDEGRDDA